MNLVNSVKNGIFWVFGNSLIVEIISMVSNIVLARYLFPTDFGVFASAMIIVRFSQRLTTFGFSSAIIQDKNVDHKLLSTAFWFNLILSIILTAITFFTADLTGQFFSEPLIALVVKILSFIFVIRTLSSVSEALLRKQLRFKPFSIINIISTIAGVAVAIVLAVQGYGVMALVANLVIVTSLRSLLIIIYASWLPSFIFSRLALNKLFNFGGWIFINTFINYFERNLDNLLIGKFIGQAELGLYSKAYGLMLLPVRNISRTVSSVMFSGFSEIQDKKDRILEHYYSGNKVISLITFPMMLGLYSIADVLIPLLLGPQWSQMTPIFKILCFAGVIQSITVLNGSVFYATGNPKIGTRLYLVSSFTVFTAFILGIYMNGVIGLSYFYVFASFLIQMYNLKLLKNIVDVSIFKFYLNIFPIVLISVVMMLLLIFLKNTLYKFSIVSNDFIILILLIIGGAIIYMSLIIILKPPVIYDLKKYFPKFFRYKLLRRLF